ncbi:hypothetical protein H4582DRAFT_2126583 [Lactarius indigo]|nr:hypothetical protein H4582DRAFT_2126583 [Lactarius indigo]
MTPSLAPADPYPPASTQQVLNNPPHQPPYRGSPLQELPWDIFGPQFGHGYSNGVRRWVVDTVNNRQRILGTSALCNSTWSAWGEPIESNDDGGGGREDILVQKLRERGGVRGGIIAHEEAPCNGSRGAMLVQPQGANKEGRTYLVFRKTHPMSPPQLLNTVFLEGERVRMWWVSVLCRPEAHLVSNPFIRGRRSRILRIGAVCGLESRQTRVEKVDIVGVGNYGHTLGEALVEILGMETRERTRPTANCASMSRNVAQATNGRI